VAGDDLNTRMDQIVERGRAEFPDFDESSGYVVAVSADRDGLRHALGELGDDAHRVVARLADDPDEAARLLALRGPKLGAAIAKFAAKTSAPPAATPSPSRPEPPPVLHDPSAPMKDWVAAWDKRNDGHKPYEPKSRDLYDPNISSADFNAELDRQEAAKRAATRERNDAYVKLMRKAP
jgi:hypothetical protein